MNSPAVNSVKNATKRLRKDFPKAFTQCSEPAVLYFKCIELNDIHNVKKHQCSAEFNQLKSCFQNALKNLS